MAMQTEIAADSVYKPFSSKIAALLYLLVHSPRPIVSYYESASVYDFEGRVYLINQL